VPFGSTNPPDRLRENKFMKSMQIVTFTLATLVLVACDSYGAEVKPLSKPQAEKLLALLGYEEIEVGAVIQHQSILSGAPSVSMVIAIGRSQGEIKKIEQTFYYDTESGWFFYQFDNPSNKLRMWTLDGYKELRPKFSLTDSSAAEIIIGSWRSRSGVMFRFTEDSRWLQTFHDQSFSGTWKIERGVVIFTFLTSTNENYPSGTVTRWQILDLDKRKLILKFPDEREIIFSRR
jgi:hypothetical protein